VSPPDTAKDPVSLRVETTDVGLAGIDYYEISSGATSVVTSATGIFSGVEPAAQGTNTLVIVAVDNAGNTSGSTTADVFYDTVSPTQPTVTSGPTTPTAAPVSFTVTSTDADPSSGLVTYRIIAGTETVPLEPADPTSGSFTDVTPAGQGSNAIQVVAIDGAGNTSVARTIDVFYDTQPPSVSNFGAGPTSRTDATTTTRTLTVWADLTDISLPVVAAFATSPTGPWSYGSFTSGTTTYQLPPGVDTYTVYAMFRDALGNTTASPSSHEIVYDNLVPNAPTITSAPTTPTNGAVSFSVHATDNGPADIAYYRITAGAEGVPIEESLGSFTGVTPAVQGWNTLSIVAVDGAGNVGPPVTTDVFYDPVAPGRPTVVTAPADPATGPVSFEVFSTDADPSSEIARYEITGGTSAGPTTSADGTFDTVTPASQGDNTITVVAVDKAGNTSSARSISVFYDSEPPSVSNFGVGETARTDTTTTSRTVTVWADVTDISTPVQAKFALTSAGLSGATYSSFTSGSTTFELPDTPDTYTVYAMFRDDLGQESGEVSDTIEYAP
jgi:hypothetical protein